MNKVIIEFDYCNDCPYFMYQHTRDIEVIKGFNHSELVRNHKCKITGNIVQKEYSIDGYQKMKTPNDCPLLM